MADLGEHVTRAQCVPLTCREHGTIGHLDFNELEFGSAAAEEEIPLREQQHRGLVVTQHRLLFRNCKNYKTHIFLDMLGA
jgi:hypothetical protein